MNVSAHQSHKPHETNPEQLEVQLGAAVEQRSVFFSLRPGSGANNQSRSRSSRVPPCRGPESHFHHSANTSNMSHLMTRLPALRGVSPPYARTTPGAAAGLCRSRGSIVRIECEDLCTAGFSWINLLLFKKKQRFFIP